MKEEIFIENDGVIGLVLKSQDGEATTWTFLHPHIELVSMNMIESGEITVKIMAKKPGDK